MNQEAEAKAARARITAANQRNSPLLRSPAELRNRIYEYTLGGHEIWMGAFSSRTKRTKLGIHPLGDVPPLALLKVCSQVNAEAARLPYSLNTFIFNKPHALDLFSKTLPMPATRMIRSLRLLCCDMFERSLGVIAFPISPFKGLQELQVYHGETMRFPWNWSEEAEAKLSNVLTQLKAGSPNLKVIIRGINAESSSVRCY